MSEQRLKDFGARAEPLVEVPDFDELDRKGGRLRLRRRVSVAAVLAAVLTVTGVAITQNHRTTADRGPVSPPLPALSPAGKYPGLTMLPLDRGGYWMQTCCLPGRPTSEFTANPIAQFDVPSGWNAWVGPNRFDGHAPGRSNDEAFSLSTWYVGALILEVDAVNTHGCGVPDEHDVGTAAGLVAALRRTFAFQVVEGPVPDERFDYPATRIRVRITKALDNCGDETAVFHTTRDGMIGYLGTGRIADIWVVDVDGYPIYVQRAWSRNAPPAARAQLDSIIDSTRFSFRD